MTGAECSNSSMQPPAATGQFGQVTELCIGGRGG